MLKLYFFFLLTVVDSHPRRRKKDREDRAIVPQLLPNYTSSTLPPANQVGCNSAWLSCRYRDGCGSALHQFMSNCDSLVSGSSTDCDINCRLSIIALISTMEGERLMQCECEDADCKLQKQRVEPCRSSVQDLVSPDSLVSCTTGSYICMSDPGCKTALHYYNLNCQEMFKGTRCDMKCKNSLEILKKQQKSKKLQNCICDGSENFNCQEIKRNMKKLCLETTTNENTSESTISMELSTISGIRNITSLSSDLKERETPIKISSKKSMISIVCTFYLSYLNYVIMYSLGTLLS